jgi:hypothetical protein
MSPAIRGNVQRTVLNKAFVVMTVALFVLRNSLPPQTRQRVAKGGLTPDKTGSARKAYRILTAWRMFWGY